MMLIIIIVIIVIIIIVVIIVIIIIIVIVVVIMAFPCARPSCTLPPWHIPARWQYVSNGHMWWDFVTTYSHH